MKFWWFSCIFHHFSQRISGSFSAPWEVLISSLVPLESSFQKLSNGTRLDVGSSRGAECERERVRWNHSFWWLIFWFLKNKRLVLSATRSSDLELGTVGKLFLQAFQRHQARCWKFPLCRMRAGTSSLKAQFWWWIFIYFFFWRLQGCYRETNINSCCGRLWATLGDFFQILRP